MLKINHLTKHYKGSNKGVTDINLAIEPGDIYAFIGHNGAGKTTIIKLLCGLYDPTEGEILLNDVNVKEYNREAYFAMFSTVFQDLSFLPVTVAENITIDAQFAEFILDHADSVALQCFQNVQEQCGFAGT